MFWRRFAVVCSAQVLSSTATATSSVVDSRSFILNNSNQIKVASGDGVCVCVCVCVCLCVCVDRENLKVWKMNCSITTPPPHQHALNQLHDTPNAAHCFCFVFRILESCASSAFSLFCHGNLRMMFTNCRLVCEQAKARCIFSSAHANQPLQGEQQEEKLSLLPLSFPPLPSLPPSFPLPSPFLLSLCQFERVGFVIKPHIQLVFFNDRNSNQNNITPSLSLSSFYWFENGGGIFGGRSPVLSTPFMLNKHIEPTQQTTFSFFVFCHT